MALAALIIALLALAIAALALTYVARWTHALHQQATATPPPRHLPTSQRSPHRF